MTVHCSSLFTIRQSIVARALPVFLAVAAASNIKDPVRRIRLGVLDAVLAQKLISFPLALFALVSDLFVVFASLSPKLDFVSIW